MLHRRVEGMRAPTTLRGVRRSQLGADLGRFLAAAGGSLKKGGSAEDDA